MVSKFKTPDDMKVGNVFTTLSGDIASVVEYKNNRQVFIKFEDGTIVEVISSNLRTGEFRNRNKPSVYGVGILGYGRTPYQKGNKHSTEYKLWFGMIDRCYSPRQKLENPTYKGCTVCDEWLNFQQFCKWYDDQPNARKEGFDLDKDFTVFGNKMYSPDTCTLLPYEINYCKMFDDSTGIRQTKSGKFEARFRGEQLGTFNNFEEAVFAHKIAKTKRLHKLAEKYKSVISDIVYNNILNYNLEEV